MFNFKTFHRTVKDLVLLFSHLFFCGLFVSFLIISPAAANTPGSVTFSWLENSPEDSVIGYRLHYGPYSRFDSSGNAKTNFTYDHYIDITESQRCTVSSSGTPCETLSSEELLCETSYGSERKCTIFDLRGQLYFAMTAYDANDESDFTHELKLNLTNWAAIVPAINLLLLN